VTPGATEDPFGEAALTRGLQERLLGGVERELAEVEQLKRWAAKRDDMAGQHEKRVQDLQQVRKSTKDPEEMARLDSEIEQAEKDQRFEQDAAEEQRIWAKVHARRARQFQMVAADEATAAALASTAVNPLIAPRSDLVTDDEQAELDAITTRAQQRRVEVNMQDPVR
jgi:hypothetical protein